MCMYLYTKLAERINSDFYVVSNIVDNLVYGLINYGLRSSLDGHFCHHKKARCCGLFGLCFIKN